ncbi:MAG: (2Fe-2S)-binding protein [Candidatus Cloacimonadota bacterium]|nr:(2Fe-2S)-binding protein [Candidatus Cloacimonadota bacterium]
MINLKFKVNGKTVILDVPDNMRLLDILREKLGLTGTKEGCGIGECGACTVIMNGKAVCSCMMLASQVQGKEIITIEGVETNCKLSKLQENFIKYGAVQCGFCTPGMIMSATALLMENPNPTEKEIKTAISGNLCRCTGYIQIIQAIKATAKMIK